MLSIMGYAPAFPLRVCMISVAFAKACPCKASRSRLSHCIRVGQMALGPSPPFFYAFAIDPSRSRSFLSQSLSVRELHIAFAKAKTQQPQNSSSHSRPTVRIREAQDSSHHFSSSQMRDSLRVREEQNQNQQTSNNFSSKFDPKPPRNTPETPGTPSNYTNLSQNTTRTCSRPQIATNNIEIMNCASIQA